MPIRIKRVYEPVAASDGRRYLIDGLWPRGFTKERLRAREWLKELAPSAELRSWFAHDPARYSTFRSRYLKELEGHRDLLHRLTDEARSGTVTLLYAARDPTRCNAVVLRELIEAALGS
jgi:uncharacterized protein YeaO (DUF488 family)